MSEVLMPGFNFNNNSKTTAGDDKELFETEDSYDGVVKKEQDDGSDLIDNDEQHEQTKETDCKVCKQSPCLSGQFLTENIKDPVGLRVKATGDSWAASKYKNNYQGMCGTVVSCKHNKMNNFLNILWEHKKPRRKHKMMFNYQLPRRRRAKVHN